MIQMKQRRLNNKKQRNKQNRSSRYQNNKYQIIIPLRYPIVYRQKHNLSKSPKLTQIITKQYTDKLLLFVSTSVIEIKIILDTVLHLLLQKMHRLETCLYRL